MQYLPQILLSMTILPAAIVSIFKVGKVPGTYLPFMIFLWVGTLHEIIAILYSHWKEPHHVITNWYLLLEFFILLSLFGNWDEKGRRRKKHLVIGLILLCFWTIENFFMNKTAGYITWFTIASSVVIGILALEQIAGLVVTGKIRFKNADFLICLGLVLFSSTSAVIEVFWMYGLEQTEEFQVRVYDLQGIMNAFSNTLYFIAVLWMQLKLRYTMQW